MNVFKKFIDSFKLTEEEKKRRPDDTYLIKSAEGHGFKTAAARENAKDLTRRNFERMGIKIKK